MSKTPHKVTELPPAKLTAIVVLSLVLVGILFFQFRGETSAPISARLGVVSARLSEPSAVASSQATTGAASQVVAAAGAVSAAPRSKWEQLARSEVLRHDPFSLPASLDPSRQAQSVPGGPAAAAALQPLEQRRQAALAAVRQQRVGMVLVSPQATIATIGTRMLRVGDVFEGLRVAEIRPDGVVLVDEQTP